MGTLFGFVVGYVVGARAGSAGFDELVDSWRAIRESEEFTAFIALLGIMTAGIVVSITVEATSLAFDKHVRKELLQTSPTNSE